MFLPIDSTPSIAKPTIILSIKISKRKQDQSNKGSVKRAKKV